MSAAGTGLRDIVQIANRPLLTLGATGLSLTRLVVAILFLIAFIWLARLCERLLHRHASRRPEQFSTASAYALGRIVRYVLLALGFVLALSFIGVNFSTLAVVGGGLGIGIGFGLQTLFANFVSGIVLLIDRSLKVGDFVDLQSGVRGRVVEIAIRYTRVSTNDSVDVLVPNSEFVNGRVTNWTFDDVRRRIHVPFGAAYGTNKEVVRQAGLAAANRVPGAIVMDPERLPEVWLVSLGESSLNFELVLWVTDTLAASPARTHAQVLWMLEDELRERRIEIPFPQRDLHIRTGEWSVQPPTAGPSKHSV